jgi:alkanesulfonate monooxygenase SsuD/methylene tetrahydromethanopterin reductase-like flavin-dependent oxidoreductase (luciferase family)
VGRSDPATWPPHPWVEAGRGRVRFGVAALGVEAWTSQVALARLAEELGFDSYWTYDHPLRGAGCWTTLAGLAAGTSRIRLGSLVSCVAYRSPVELARAAADVDRISDGRLILGLGIGDDLDELERMGLPPTSIADRQQLLEETIQALRGLWGPEPLTIHGRFVRIHGANVHPGPVQRPRVPLLLAGGGERVTLRQVARLADASNFAAHERMGSAFEDADVGRKLAVLRRRCDEAGRSFDSLARSHTTMWLVLRETDQAAQARLAAIPAGWRAFGATSTLAGTPAQAIERYRALAALGITYFVVFVVGNDVATLRLLAERVAPALG